MDMDSHIMYILCVHIFTAIESMQNRVFGALGCVGRVG